MIGFPRLGNFGRLGNQLFQVASTIGIAKQAGTEACFPEWGYAKYFKEKLNSLRVNEAPVVQESHFHYDPLFYKQAYQDININGYFQSEKYFEHCKDDIKRLFTFGEHVINPLKEKYKDVFTKRVIGIHIRRKDYVNNPSYVTLTNLYYILALYEHFPKWKDCNIIFFSDDIDYCKINFGCITNAHFAEGTEIEDLCLLSMCDDFIISNSSYAWWGAWLGEKEGTKVVRPVDHFDGNLKDNSIKDLYPERWIAFDHKEKRIKLDDITFTIPVSYDSEDRRHNLNLTVCILQKNFEAPIIVGEQGSNEFAYMSQWCEYVHFSDMPYFHRTKMLNDMARMADTPFVANYDADVIFPPMQILLAVEALREGADVVSPFEGAFAGVTRNPWFKVMEKHLDVGIFGNMKFRGRGITPGAPDAVGGAVFVNKKSFFKAGGENERYISYGNEDEERWWRFNKLGLDVRRINGFLYHMDHVRLINSTNNHPNHKGNAKAWDDERNMTKEELEQYIKTWKWAY